MVPLVEFPFRNVYGPQRRPLPIILIVAPFRSAEHEQKYEAYKAAGLHFCGISSYLTFPDPIPNPYENRYHLDHPRDYVGMVRAWLHCFRTPSAQIRRVPNMLMTEADLKDPAAFLPLDVPKVYDYVYVCLADKQGEFGWQAYNRNWSLAKKCFAVFARRGLRGLIIGRDGQYEGREMNDHTPQLPFRECAACINSCRFLFVPNVCDASPRILTEAMCYNLPVLVNRRLIGGWHNVNDMTGEWFSDETDVGDVVDRLVSKLNTYRPREWFSQHRGREHSGRALAQFLRSQFPIDEPYVTI
jgi:hypothetical protein